MAVFFLALAEWIFMSVCSYKNMNELNLACSPFQFVKNCSGIAVKKKEKKKSKTRPNISRRCVNICKSLPWILPFLVGQSNIP